jgi:hypothetical protein
LILIREIPQASKPSKDGMPIRNSRFDVGNKVNMLTLHNFFSSSCLRKKIAVFLVNDEVIFECVSGGKKKSEMKSFLSEGARVMFPLSCLLEGKY